MEQPSAGTLSAQMRRVARARLAPTWRAKIIPWFQAEKWSSTFCIFQAKRLSWCAWMHWMYSIWYTLPNLSSNRTHILYRLLLHVFGTSSVSCGSTPVTILKSMLGWPASLQFLRFGRGASKYLGQYALIRKLNSQSPSALSIGLSHVSSIWSRSPARAEKLRHREHRGCFYIVNRPKQRTRGHASASNASIINIIRSSTSVSCTNKKKKKKKKNNNNNNENQNYQNSKTKRKNYKNNKYNEYLWYQKIIGIYELSV